ncbi:hypothetical protein AMC75_10665 [Staphylococcus carnosus]|uniref:complement inhibitor SCIN family protein n=1 Tax=Staphylococcus carnosus TaxID=1281 RepID=UPI0006AB93F0|nr:complement inhibitor SCIN family protein [Staphylococcus carnosus]KOR12185.1 hypothetical protein AMC75_10665 [Staphylococcus carnosus]
MNFKQFLLSGLAVALLGSAGASVFSNQAEAASYGVYEFRNYDITAKENLKNLKNLLDASSYYKAMAKESGATLYQNKLNQAIYFAKKQQDASNDSQVVTAINRLSTVYNEVFQIHLQTEKGSSNVQSKKTELQNLIIKANGLLTESHHLMNQDEAQLKKSRTSTSCIEPSATRL